MLKALGCYGTIVRVTDFGLNQGRVSAGGAGFQGVCWKRGLISNLQTLQTPLARVSPPALVGAAQGYR